MLGDYSNLHASLAAELRRRGHSVTVVSDRGRYMQTDADVELKRDPGLSGSFRYLFRMMSLLPSWIDYDVVQLINPVFLKLRPGKLKIIFDILKKNNRSVFLTLCGNDHFFVKDCVETDLFRFSEFRVGKEKAPLVVADPQRETGWLIPAHAAYTQHLYDNIDGAMSVLPEYDMSARLHMNPSKLTFTNLPIDIEAIDYTPLPLDGGPLRIMIGMRAGMEIQKGTAKIAGICREIEAEMPDKCRVEIVRNLPLKDYLEKLRQSHIVIDQLYSYSPALNALQTMAFGRISASGGQPEYYEYIGEQSRPVFCLDPLEDDATIKRRLKELIMDPARMRQMSEDGRRLVEKHNNLKTVAAKFEAHWVRQLGI